MHRSSFESLRDGIANMRSSVSEGVQWALGALCFGFAMTLLVHALVAA